MQETIYVLYSSRNEVIICIREDEARVIKEFFDEGGRVLEEYDRLQTTDIPHLSSTVHLEVT